MEKLSSYSQLLEINGNQLTKHYIQSLSKQEREDLVEPIFKIFRNTGFLYPDDSPETLKKEYKRLIDFQPDTSTMEVYNNSSLATKICKNFCRSFYNATDPRSPTMTDIFNDDAKLRKSIRNRLGMEWIDDNEKGPGVNEAFNFSFKMLIQSYRSQHLCGMVSLFKPDIAKYLVMKYSEPGDMIGDYSCGFGARLLGAASCDRKYQGTDPMTVPELQEMVRFYDFKDVRLIQSGSEDFRGDQDSVDFYYSSPPYFNQEVYSKDISQAYNKGEDYFYNTYWKKTLENVHYMLKPNKWFGLNVINYPKMVTMAEECFGKPVETIKLKTTRSHLNKKGKEDAIKYEPIYMFRKV